MNENRQGLISWFAGNPVAANLLMAFLLFAGAVSALGIRQEFMPDMQLDVIRVAVSFPGATPEEVEAQVCRKVESALSGVRGIRRLRSVAGEGVGTVLAEIQFRVPTERVREDIRQAVDGIDDLPAKAERPVVSIQSIEEGVLWLIVSGNMDERSLKKISRQVYDDLLALPEIGKISLEGVRDDEIVIETDEDVLLRYGLTVQDVGEEVRKASLAMPLGAIRSDGGEILLRADGQAKSGTDFGRIPILTMVDGGIVRLADIARVRDGFAETDWFLRYQGEKAAGIQVFRAGQQSIREVSRAVHGYAVKKRSELPAGVHLSVIADTSVPLNEQIAMMLNNAVSGGLLVFITLTLFLRMRLAFWVVAGMPVCFLGTIWVMNMDRFDLSINMLTLFGFILVLGILVDDAIVIGESVHSETSRNGHGLAQTVAGVGRVALPATFGVLTTMAAFLPIFMLPGMNGRLWGNIAWVVVFCLAFSLLESKLILPAHLARLAPVRNTQANRLLNAIQQRMNGGLCWCVGRLYRPSLHLALRWRHSLLALFAAAAMLTWAAVEGGKIRMVFFPEFESDTLEVELAMPGGTPFQITDDLAGRIERAAQEVNTKVRQHLGLDVDVIRHLIAFSGSATDAWFYAELLPAEQRPMISSQEIAGLWRQQVGAVPGASRLVFSGVEDDGEPPVEVRLTGKDFMQLRKVSAEVRGRLTEIGGVFDIRDSLRQGKKEMHISLLPGAESLGLQLADIAGQIDRSVYGEKVQTLQRQGEEVDVYVRYPRGLRDSAADIEQMHLAAGERHLAAADVARFSPVQGVLEIERIERKRVVSITANIDSRTIEPRLVVDELQGTILPEILKRYPGVEAVLAGQEEGRHESTRAMVKGSLIALFVIYALMAVPLGSYVQPLLIMTAIPFGIVGSFWGHWWLGLPVSVLSLCGIIALAGVVVNDSLVLVDYVNTRKRGGSSSLRAVCSAGPARFRAILLTSVTTVIGLVPMMTEKSLQAQFLIPMAVSLAFGLMFSTLITLYLIPALYLVGDDIRGIAAVPAADRPGRLQPAVRPSGETNHVIS